MDNSRQNKTDVGSNCSAVFDAETARKTDAMIELVTGHACEGRTGGHCPIFPRPESLTKTSVSA